MDKPGAVYTVKAAQSSGSYGLLQCVCAKQGFTFYTSTNKVFVSEDLSHYHEAKGER